MNNLDNNSETQNNEIIDIIFERYDELNEENKDHYISEMIEYLYIYLYKGNISFKSEDIIHLFNLSKEELTTLKAVHFLLSCEIRKLFINMPHLLRNLAHSTNREDVEYRGIIRGNINWNKTIKTRISQGFNDSSLFVCSPPLKHYDLDENKILKFLLREIVSLFEDSLDFINSKESNLDFSKLYNINESWHDLADYIYQQSIITLRNVYLNDVEDVEDISAFALDKAFTHRNPLYHDVAKAYELYEKLFIMDDLECLKELIEKQVLAVSDNDTLYELYIFAKMIKYLEEVSLDNSFEISIYYKDHNNPVVGKLNDGNEVKIWYQNVPQTFSDNSLYLKLTQDKKYGFKTAVRRPDLIVEVIKEGISYFRIVEVKNSSKDKYMRNSFYKILGYCRDFKGVNFTNSIPFVLVDWNGSEISKDDENIIFNQEKIIVLNKREFEKNIMKLFEI